MAGRVPYDETRPTSIAELLASIDPREQRTMTVRFGLDYSILATGTLADVVAYGRSLGLTVDTFRFGGLLVRRTRVVVTGPWLQIRQLLVVIAELEQDT